MIDLVAERMVKERKVRVDRAKEIIEELTKKQYAITMYSAKTSTAT